MRAATSWAPWTAAPSVSSSSVSCSRADTATLAATTPAPTTNTDAAAVRALTEPRIGLACHTGWSESGRSERREVAHDVLGAGTGNGVDVVGAVGQVDLDHGGQVDLDRVGEVDPDRVGQV